MVSPSENLVDLLQEKEKEKEKDCPTKSTYSEEFTGISPLNSPRFISTKN